MKYLIIAVMVALSFLLACGDPPYVVDDSRYGAKRTTVVIHAIGGIDTVTLDIRGDLRIEYGDLRHDGGVVAKDVSHFSIIK